MSQMKCLSPSGKRHDIFTRFVFYIMHQKIPAWPASREGRRNSDRLLRLLLVTPIFAHLVAAIGESATSLDIFHI
jgi:hypothetical protein